MPNEGGGQVFFAGTTLAYLAEPRFAVTSLDLRRGPEDLIRVHENPAIAQYPIDFTKELSLLGPVEVMDGERGHDGLVLSRERFPRVVHDAKLEAFGLVCEALPCHPEHLRRDVHQRDPGAGKSLWTNALNSPVPAPRSRTRMASSRSYGIASTAVP